jgi:5-dehydro-4-deoxyglucarate dehydratase
MNALLTSFYLPLVALRDKVPGGAVSLVKAGATLHGLHMGPVRPPLLSATEDQMVALASILWDGMTALEKLP